MVERISRKTFVHRFAELAYLMAGLLMLGLTVRTTLHTVKIGGNILIWGIRYLPRDNIVCVSIWAVVIPTIFFLSACTFVAAVLLRWTNALRCANGLKESRKLFWNRLSYLSPIYVRPLVKKLVKCACNRYAQPLENRLRKIGRTVYCLAIERSDVKNNGGIRL